MAEGSKWEGGGDGGRGFDVVSWCGGVAVLKFLCMIMMMPDYRGEWEEDIGSMPKFSIYDKLLYNSKDVSLSPYGEYWRQMKSIYVLQLLSNRRVWSFKGIREEETALLMEKIQENYNAQALNNLSEMFVVFTNDVVCRVAFGRKFNENQKSGIVDFKEVLKEFVELLGLFNIGDFIPWLAWVNNFNGLNVRLKKVAKRFDLILEEILMQHTDKLNRTGNSSDNEYENKKDNSAGFPLERDSIKAQILDAFAAGTDTAYAVLEWAMTELLRNPEVMEKLQNEVREIAGEKEHLTEDDLEKMKYLKAVIKETLRLHPPVPLLVPRESTHDLKINGYDISSRTLVFLNAWAIQRDPDIWENPEIFYPERLMQSTIDFKGMNFELIPFGGGRRFCPGISFAMANNELVLANLMHKFNSILPDGVNSETLDMSESIGLTIHRKTPLLALATPHWSTSSIFCKLLYDCREMIGHLHKLGTHTQHSLQSLLEKYGELMLIYLGSRPTVIVSSERIANEIMKTHDVVFSNRPRSSIND
ncbi:Cytochrome P450 71A4 [Bienertia sinuspersici]